MAKNYVVNSFFWGVVAKIIDAGIKFISVPFLLAYFGKQEFGLIALATSVNAYLQLLDMGVNTGAVKYFSEWIAAKNYNLLDTVARTSITFYGLVGVVNAVLLAIVAFWGMNFFSVTPEQVPALRNMFLILALFAIFNWATSVFNQLITANENIAFIQKINVIRSVLSLLIIFITIWAKWSVVWYFIGFTLINSLMIIPFYTKAKQDGLIKSFYPAWDWINFGTIFKYSLAIIVMGIFQMSATKLRPIVLSISSDDGVGIVADYRILETITIFIISIGGMFIAIFMPKTSKLLLENDHEKVRTFAYDTTLYTSIVCVILCLPFIVAGKDILTLYVGPSYAYLAKWLYIWVLTILFFLHNSPVASLVLASGKTRVLVYSSAIACVTSIIVNALLAKQLGVGSAIIGYSIYIAIQMSFYYFYFNRKILDLDSLKLFSSFLIPALIGFAAAIAVYFLNIQISYLPAQIILKLGVWFTLFAGFLVIFKVIKINEISVFLKRK